MSRKHIRWLHEQLPLLVSKDVLSPEAAAKVATYYDQEQTGETRSIARTIFAVLGALLIGGGIILLVAHNWADFTRPMRAGISFALLLLGQCAALAAIRREAVSTGLREGAGLFVQLTCGAGIALIAQTYHVSDDFGGFMLTWMACTLPLVYALNATSPALVYLAGITTWASHVNGWQDRGDPTTWWLWIVLLAPFVIQQMRHHPYQSRTIFLMWGLAVAMSVGTAICLDSGWRNLWLVIYSGLYVSMYLAGSFWQGEGTSLWQRPLTFIGGAGATILAFCLTFADTWDHMGWYDAYGTGRMTGWAGVHDIGLALLVTVISLLLMVTCRRRGQSFRLGLGILPIITAFGYVFASSVESDVVMLAFLILSNLYFFAFGIVMLIEGLRERRLGTVNYGMVVMSSLILARFFDSDYGFIAKGIVFILLGIGFLSVNLFLSRRKGAVS